MDSPFGAPAGSIDELSAHGLKNEFSTVSERSLESMTFSDRVQPRQMSSGVTRGTWRMSNSDGSYITIGLIPDTDSEFGIAFFSSEGTQLFKLTGETLYFYDKETGDNNIQLGTLTNGESGAAFAKDGEDLTEALTEDD